MEQTLRRGQEKRNHILFTDESLVELIQQLIHKTCKSGVSFPIKCVHQVIKTCLSHGHKRYLFQRKERKNGTPQGVKIDGKYYRENIPVF